jgi:hypothetical protein
MFCGICGRTVEAGEAMCVSCREEINEQRGRMGMPPLGEVEAAVPPEMKVLLPLTGYEHITTRPVLVEVGLAASGLRDVDEADRDALGIAVRELARAKGGRRVRQALIGIAAICVRWATRIPADLSESEPMSDGKGGRRATVNI